MHIKKPCKYLVFCKKGKYSLPKYPLNSLIFKLILHYDRKNVEICKYRSTNTAKKICE